MELPHRTVAPPQSTGAAGPGRWQLLTGMEPRGSMLHIRSLVALCATYPERLAEAGRDVEWAGFLPAGAWHAETGGPRRRVAGSLARGDLARGTPGAAERRPDRSLPLTAGPPSAPDAVLRWSA